MQFVIPAIVTEHFHLRPGDKVADFGTGKGFFLQSLADAVTPKGEVLLCEIQKDLVEFVNEQIRLGGYSHVKTIWCDLEEPGGVHISPGTLDAGILVNTLFQLEDKAAAAQEMVRAVRPGGKLFVIDWADSQPGVGPAPEVIISAADCTALLEAHGCVFERGFPAGEHHYGLAFRKV